MYPNLEAELKRKNIKRVDLAEHLNCVLSTISSKMLGKTDFTFSELKKIKKLLGVDTPLEDLFEWQDSSRTA